MFTEEQIKSAHSKVRSGEDFPYYVQDLVKLGVISYETHVIDGHTEYFGKGGYKVISAKIYGGLIIADESNIGLFKAVLTAHQQGKTDYFTFCSDCAKTGVEKWSVSMEKMTCTYCDKAGNEVLTEQIPAA